MRPNKRKEALIPTSLLLSRFKYDEQTGKLYYIQRYTSEFKSEMACNQWNGRFAGKEAGWDNLGYRCVEICGHPFKVHRVIWAIKTGTWPGDVVDHVDRDRQNNRWDNLREVTKSENNINRKYVPHGDTPSGVKGVCYRKRSNLYETYSLGEPGSRRYLGGYKTKEEAAQAVYNDLKERGLEHLAT